MTLDWLKIKILWPFATSSGRSVITNAVLQDVFTPAQLVQMGTRIALQFSLLLSRQMWATMRSEAAAAELPEQSCTAGAESPLTRCIAAACKVQHCCQLALYIAPACSEVSCDQVCNQKPQCPSCSRESLFQNLVQLVGAGAGAVSFVLSLSAVGVKVKVTYIGADPWKSLSKRSDCTTKNGQSCLHKLPLIKRDICAGSQLLLCSCANAIGSSMLRSAETGYYD